MIAYQQQQQQQSGKVASNNVAAVPPASASLANSKLRFGNTGISSWDMSSNIGSSGSSHTRSTRNNDHFSTTMPKSFGASTTRTGGNSTYRLHSGNGDAYATTTTTTTTSTTMRNQQESRGSNRAVNPAFAAPHWQNYHNHYIQHHKEKDREAAGTVKTRSVRRVPNANDLAQWRPTARTSTPSTATTTTMAAPSKASGARESVPLMSSTFQGTDSTMLSGLSLALALDKHKAPTSNVVSSSTLKVDTVSAAKPSVPLFDVAQTRTPNLLSPAISMKTPAYIDPESLPFELGSSITDNTTGKQYKLLSVLGEGSYAVVYLARSSDDGAKYALKCLSKLGLSARQLALQRTELEIHASVCPHPHIVTLYSHFETRDWLFLVMERVAGPDLYDYITQHPAFNANQEERRFVEATRLFEQMIDAVAHIHALKAYHRDLKPENFILGADGNLKLTDFGLATRESLSTDFECGSKPYMSYENRNGGLNPNDPTVYGPRDDYSPRLSDVWALGVLFLNLLFAQSPWTDPSRESCFKFCRFLREGAGFLVSQFPRLPREVADFLVTRVFSPESGRCNVMELKQWVQDLGYPFTLTSSPTSSRPTASRHKTNNIAVPAGTSARTTVAVPASSAATHSAKPHAAGSIGKKWSPMQQGSFGSSAAKIPYVPHAVLASTALALDSAVAAPSSKPRSPHNKRFAAMHQPAGANGLKPSHMSTSVPAAVFSQIIPATQAAAARKMMPREFNPTAAKAAAAILQSSMLCLPKNGLGQGKIDDSIGIDGEFCEDDENDVDDSEYGNSAGSNGHLEDLSEAIEEEDDYQVPTTASSAAYRSAAADIARTFPKQPVSTSLGFSLSKDLALFDSDEDMDFSEPISFDEFARPPIRVAPKSLPAQVMSKLSASALKRPLPLSANTTPTATTAASGATSGANATGSSTVSNSSFVDDLDIVGHFSDGNDSGDRAGSSSRSTNRVRFKDIPQAPTAPPGVVLAGRASRTGGNAAASAIMTSADSSLTATLVTPSVEYYSPHMKNMTSTEAVVPVSAATLLSTGNGNGSSSGNNRPKPNAIDDVDADDESDNWRVRTNNGGPAKSSSKIVSKSHTHGHNSKAARPTGSRHRDMYPNTATHTKTNSPALGAKHSGIPVMHSLPTPFKPLMSASNNSTNSGRSARLKFDYEEPSFSWAEDVEDLPIPSLNNVLHTNAPKSSKLKSTTKPKHVSSASAASYDEDALSDELFWISDDDNFHQSGGGMFDMEL
ncbi:hypothetical protein GGI15_001258 [Coemansia interrupta]|uniref:Protein kinase domain-containing protein n=1 Tax=Coemansia interrupta TaxID=1126814 RepID=A0A9W8HIC5_9FUNG|nr:hypothetical protein GGI15_001258 [Coemansia interrupta]